MKLGFGIPLMLAALAWLLQACCGCSGDGGPDEGEFLAMTYNVAGLPEGLSGSHPEVNIPRISPLLNAYDLVLVQEDFWYHEQLVAETSHPYRSDPMWEEPEYTEMGDGLNRFSVFPFGELSRFTWEICHGGLDHGSDCLTTKGFSVARHELARGVHIDVYNLHMDASSSEEDKQARAAQTEQLLEEIAASSGNRAVIVAGDTNMNPDGTQDGITLERLLSGADLQDTCRALDCGQERIDRIMFRSSDAVSLIPLSWSVPDEFVDQEGEGLSDHDPSAARFSWERIGQ